MALPASGTISFQNFNTDRGLSSTATIDMDTAAIAYGIPTKPHGMDEFYGKSAGGPPPPPPPPPPPTYYYHFVRPCGGGTPVYTVRYTLYLDVNKAVNLFGPGGCWEVTGVAGVGLFDYTVSTVYADCTACASTPPPPPPPALSITNGSVTCSSGGNFTSTLSGGTGTYDWVAIDTSQANVSNAILGISGTRVAPSGGSSHSWISLADGTYYTAVMDSGGTYQVQTTSVSVSCSSPPTPPPTPPSLVLTSYSTGTSSGAEAGCYTGDNYTDFTVTLLDQFNNPIAAPSNQNFTITYDYNDVQDAYGAGYVPGSIIILTVTTGNSSGTLRFYSRQYVNCNFSSLCDGSCYNESTGMYVSSSPI